MPDIALSRKKFFYLSKKRFADFDPEVKVTGLSAVTSVLAHAFEPDPLALLYSGWNLDHYVTGIGRVGIVIADLPSF